MANTKTFTLTINGVDTAITNISQLEKTVERLDNELKQADFGSESFARLEKEAKAARAELDKINNSSQAVAAQANEAGNTATKMGGSFKDAFGIANLAAGDTAEAIGGLEGSFGKAQNALGTLKNGFGTLKGAIASTGIGLLLVAFGLLVTYFTQSQEGINLIQRKTAALQAVFAVFSKIAIGLGKSLFEALSNPKKALTDLVDLIETNLTNRIKSFSVILDGIINKDFTKVANGFTQMATGITDASSKLSKLGSQFTELGNQASKAATEAEAIVALNQRIAASERDLGVKRAESRAQIEGLKKLSDDSTKSTAVRLAATKQAATIENELLAEQLKLQQQKIDNIKRENANKASITNEDRDRLAEAKKERADTAQESLTLQTELQNKVNSINTEAAGKAKTIRDNITTAESEALNLRNARQLAAAKQGTVEYLNAQKEKLALDARLAVQAIEAKIVDEKKANLLSVKEKAALEAQKLEIVKTAQEAQKRLDEDYNKSRTQKAAEDELAVAQIRVIGLQEGSKAYVDALIKQNQAEQVLALAKLENTKENEQARSLIIAQYAQKNADITKQFAQAQLVKTSQDTADIAAIKLIGLKAGSKAYTEALVSQSQAETQLALAQLANTKDNEIARNKIIAEGVEKEKQIRQAAAKANLDSALNLETQLATQIGAIYQAQSEARMQALDAQLNEAQAAIDSAKAASDGLKSELDASQSRIDDLESKLVTSKGLERDKIIKQLEQERLKNQQIAADKKKEDTRIAQAEAAKVAIEKQKTKEQEKQAQIQQVLNALAAVNAAIGATQAAVESVKAIAAAGSGGKFGFDNIAYIIGATAAIATAFVAVKNAAKGFAEGGYTGDGGKYEPAGIVHRGEYVIPAHIVANPTYSGTINSLESARTGGYAQGGLVTLPPTQLPSSGVDMGVLVAMQAELVSLRKDTNAALNKPVYISHTEYKQYDAKNATIQERFLK